MNQTRKLTLHARHEHTRTVDANGDRNAQATLPSMRSRLIEWSPPVGTFYGVDRFILPVVKLFQTGGAQVSGNTRLFFGKQRPGDSSPRMADGYLLMHSFVDLSTAQQRDADNHRTLRVDLGARIVLREDELLVIYAEGPDVIDPTEPGTTLELDVGYQTI